MHWTFLFGSFRGHEDPWRKKLNLERIQGSWFHVFYVHIRFLVHIFKTYPWTRFSGPTPSYNQHKRLTTYNLHRDIFLTSTQTIHTLTYISKLGRFGFWNSGLKFHPKIESVFKFEQNSVRKVNFRVFLSTQTNKITSKLIQNSTKLIQNHPKFSQILPA